MPTNVTGQSSKRLLSTPCDSKKEPISPRHGQNALDSENVLNCLDEENQLKFALMLCIVILLELLYRREYLLQLHNFLVLPGLELVDVRKVYISFPSPHSEVCLYHVVHLIHQPLVILLAVKSVFKHPGAFMEPQLGQSLNIPAGRSFDLHYSLEYFGHIPQVESVMEF